MQDVLPEAYIGAPCRGVDVEQLALDGVLTLEELCGDLEVELVAAQHIDGVRGE